MKTKKPIGRPRAIDNKTYKRMIQAYQRLLIKHEGKQEVTVDMLKRHMGMSCHTKTMRNAFHEHGVYFRPYYEKPDSTPDDIKARGG